MIYRPGYSGLEDIDPDFTAFLVGSHSWGASLARSGSSPLRLQFAPQVHNVEIVREFDVVEADDGVAGDGALQLDVVREPDRQSLQRQATLGGMAFAQTQ